MARRCRFSGLEVADGIRPAGGRPTEYRSLAARNAAQAERLLVQRLEAVPMTSAARSSLRRRLLRAIDAIQIAGPGGAPG